MDSAIIHYKQKESNEMPSLSTYASHKLIRPSISNDEDKKINIDWLIVELALA